MQAAGGPFGRQPGRYGTRTTVTGGNLQQRGGIVSEDVTNRQRSGLADTAATFTARFLLNRFARAFSQSNVSFELYLPDGVARRFGQGTPSFRVTLKNRNAVRAVTSLDQGKFADAYLAGDIGIDGDMLRLFELRQSMADLHPLVTAWRFLQPLLFGQVRTNKAAIASHYDIDPEFFLSFLDPKTPCYTQGVFESADETLDVATIRKFDYCYERLKLKPGDHILEIGPGWGAWFEYASRRGIKCTGITISQSSTDYMNRRAKELGRDWELIHADLLNYHTDRRYDAIIIMGVIEHLPQYDRVLAKFTSLLKPGGNVFLDGSACARKYELSSFMVKYIYPGNHSFLVLHDFLEKLTSTPLRVLEIFNDRYSYFLTFQQWARNFDANREFVIERFSEFNYRRFRLYLWGAAYEFLSRSLDCYRMIIHYPGEDATV
jgi:cyclopropane-fatty-acyl-phospholipid synthase